MKCKCVDCGYLSLASNDSQGTLKEASVEYRNWNPGYGSQPMAYCFRLSDRLGWNGDVEISPKETFEKVKAERDCPAFYPWTQGFSPKEHRLMEVQDLTEERRFMAEASRHTETLNASNNNTYANLLSAAIGAIATLAAVFLGRAFEVLGLAKQVLELMLEQARK